MHRVLLIEDNPGDARLIREMLAEVPGAPFEIECAGRLAEGLERLLAGGVGLVLLDLSLPDSMGLETFAKVYAHSPDVPIIVLTGNDDSNLALAAVKRGPQDYLAKARLDGELLLRSMQYAIERKRYQLQLEHQANYDALTGLPNRTLLNDRLRQSVYGQRLRRAVAVAVIDLDHFKVVNSSLGHAAGDRLLKAMAGRLRGMLRDGDTVARLGGDEFVLILNDQSSEEIIYRAMQRITEELARPLEIDGKDLVVTCSAGISLYPQDGPDVETLLRNADAAMYRAKERGRNNFQFYTAEMNERVNERLALESALRRAPPACLSEPRGPAQGRDHRGGGTAALAAPGMGPGAPGALRPARRGDRAHRAHRRVRSAGGLPPDAPLERRRTRARAHLGQPVSAPVPRGRPGAHGVARARGNRHPSAEPRARANREHGDARRGRGHRHAAGAEVARCVAVGRRFRHRLFEPFVPREPSDRQAEDRPLLRAGHRRRRGRKWGRERGRARAGDHLPRPQSRDARGRGRRRNRRTGALPSSGGLRRGAGFLLRRSGAASPARCAPREDSGPQTRLTKRVE